MIQVGKPIGDLKVSGFSKSVETSKSSFNIFQSSGYGPLDHENNPTGQGTGVRSALGVCRISTMSCSNNLIKIILEFADDAQEQAQDEDHDSLMSCAPVQCHDSVYVV